MESKRITRHIDRLLLDPNNYRFIDKPEYRLISEDMVADDRVQQRTLLLLLGPNNENVKDLISSFTTNGFLPIDQIQVTPSGDKHLVLEGNRRTATLKYLFSQFKLGNDIGKLTESDFKSVTIVEISNEDPVQHLITMGIQHIGGKKRWSAVNEAQLIDDLITKYNMSEDSVCDSLGTTIQSLRRSRRTLFLINQYKESDFGDQFSPDMFSIFQAVIGSPAMKSWISWDDYEYQANHELRLTRLFSWISETEEIEFDENGTEVQIVKEPIINQYRQIKDLSEFINDEKALKRMEESRSLAEGHMHSDMLGEERLKDAMATIKREVNVAFSFSEHLTQTDYEEIDRLKGKLDRLIPASRAIISIANKKVAGYFQQQVIRHFEDASITQYRKLKNFSISNLSRVNIFAGGNNMGKTSLLEVFFLLTQLNDINAFLEIEKIRGKFIDGLPAKWVDQNFKSTVSVSGNYDGLPVSLMIKREETLENVVKTTYLSTITEYATLDGIQLTSSIHLHSNSEPELRFQKAQIICQAAFTSPYSRNNILLQQAHASAVQEKYFDEVVSFIKENLDSNIENIELVSDEGQNRFLISSSSLEEALDITKYGEGLQRVFEIALLMGYCRNGVLCIDEVDSGIHKNLLIPFTRFIQECSTRFNVQVFLSTHSKECIDAFVENGCDNKHLTAYALSVDTEGKMTCKYIDGDRLELLVENINFDIR